ncbi:MAG: hypothetical protein RLZZ347_617 [Candidatus Parcubacteria bacterium]|jgi:hypothetical protein
MELIKSIKKMSESKSITKIICVLVACILLALTFEAGVFVGFHKASFAYRFGDNYHQLFDGGMHSGRFFSKNDFVKGGMMNAHGAIGKIVKVDLPTFVLEGKDSVEKVITVNNKTLIKQFRDTATTTNLSVGSEVMVLGTPTTDGTIEATLIRILPDLATSTIRTMPMMQWTR